MQLTPIPAFAPLERSLGLGLGVSKLVAAAVDAPVMWVPDGVDAICKVDETGEGNNKKPGLVLEVIAFGSVWFRAKILNFWFDDMSMSVPIVHATPSVV